MRDETPWTHPLIERAGSLMSGAVIRIRITMSGRRPAPDPARLCCGGGVAQGGGYPLPPYPTNRSNPPTRMGGEVSRSPLPPPARTGPPCHFRVTLPRPLHAGAAPGRAGGDAGNSAFIPFLRRGGIRHTPPLQIFPEGVTPLP